MNSSKNVDSSKVLTTPTFLRSLESRLPSLSDQQKKIGAFILRHHRKAAFMTAANLAQQSRVSAPTVIRFATTLGYKGYSELQKVLQSLVQGELHTNEFLSVTHHERINPLKDVFDEEISALRQIKEDISYQDFNLAVDLLFKAQRIVVAGHKASAGVSAHAAYILGKIHSDVALLTTTEAFDAFSTIQSLGSHDVALIFTVIYYPQETLKLIRILHAKGVKVVLISDFTTFPESQLTEVILPVNIIFHAFLDGMAPMMCLADALTLAVYKRDPDAAKARLKEFNAFNEQAGSFLQVCRFSE